jgi:hypothetical protein
MQGQVSALYLAGVLRRQEPGRGADWTARQWGLLAAAVAAPALAILSTVQFVH